MKRNLYYVKLASITVCQLKAQNMKFLINFSVFFCMAQLTTAEIHTVVCCFNVLYLQVMTLLIVLYYNKHTQNWHNCAKM